MYACTYACVSTETTSIVRVVLVHMNDNAYVDETTNCCLLLSLIFKCNIQQIALLTEMLRAC